MLVPFSGQFFQSRGNWSVMESREPQTGGIGSRIRAIRGASVMVDSDLAALYAVTAKALLQAVRPQSNTLPVTLHVSADESSGCNFEVTDCDPPRCGSIPRSTR
jgi:hypothetical protein